MNLLTLLCFALWLGLVSSSADSPEYCNRLDGKPGYCVPFNQCKLINDMYSRVRSKQVTPEEMTYLRNSRCPVHKSRHVCCEDEKASEGMRMLQSQGCGNFTEVKTVGGYETELMSRPWMALLKFKIKDDEEGFGCGGTLISNRYILTAAHCFANHRLSEIRLGEHNITTIEDCTTKRRKIICAPPVEDIGFDKIFIHEAYTSSTGKNDIALVRLSRDVEFKRHIYPICLPLNQTHQDLPETLREFRVTGWGRTEYSISSDVPMETKISKRDRSECAESFRRQITTKQLCAGDRGKDSCNGDSGGPLIFPHAFNGIQRLIQFGIVSYGSRQCGDGNPGVYTNVGKYIHWIAAKIGSEGSR